MKIFRRFREILIPGRGIRKYVVYAIGEIILVAIGILIALSVTNLNEQNKIKSNTIQTAKLVVAKMKQDTAEIRTVLKTWDSYDSTIETILYKTPPDQPILKTCELCQDILFATELPDISGKVNDLIAREKLSSGTIENKLYQIDELYKENIYTNQIYQDGITEALIDNLKYLKDTHAWFAPFISNGLCNEACNEYFTTSSDFRNRVAYLNQLAYESYYGHLKRLDANIQKNITELVSLTGKQE